MATKTLRVFAEYTSTGFVPMPTAGNIDYGYTLGSTFPATTPTTFQTDNPDLVVTVTAMTDFYVWIRINGQAWNPSYTRNVRVYPDSPNINNVVMNMIIATGPAGVGAYTQLVQTSNRLYFNGATTDSIYNSKFAGKTYINELNFGTAPGLATVATSGAYADLTGKPTLATVATSGLFTDLSSKPSGTAPLSYNSGTNSFVITQANTSTNGFLSSTDWNTFNNKLATPAGTTLQYVDGTGALQTFPVLASADKLVINVRNSSGVSMPKGSVVYINGATGNKPTVALSQGNSDATSAQTLGLLQATLANNAEGNVVIAGSVIDLNTSAFTEGQQLYLSPTTAGSYTATKQYAPNHLVYVGVVTRSHVSLGVIEVKVQNGYEMDELHNVSAQSPSNNDGLFYNTTTSLWEKKSIATVLGYTPYNGTDTSIKALFSASAPLSYSNGVYGISQATTSSNGYLSSTDWNTFNNKGTGSGSVTSVAMTVPTELSISGTPITTSGTLALSLTAGYIIPTTANVAQWENAYTNRITSLTLNGSSGTATLASNVLNIPSYTLIGLGGQPALSGTGFVKISGTTISYDNASYLPSTGGIMTSSIGFADSGKRGIYGTMGGNDSWFIGAGALATDNGFIEIATGDNGNEPIYVRQYNGDPYTTGTVTRTATILDGSGNTIFPNTLTATTLIKSGGTSSQYLMADGSVSTITNNITGTGTINELAYFNTASTVASLSVATYPSFTELSYVKGVTSAIQTQLNTKQATVSLTTTGTSGAATFSSGTLNIPQYAAALSGTTNYIPKFTSSTAIGNSAITDDGTTVTLVSRALSGTSATFSGLITGSNTITIGNGVNTANSTLNLSGVSGTSFGFSINNDANGLSIACSSGNIPLKLSSGGIATFSNSAAFGLTPSTISEGKILQLNVAGYGLWQGYGNMYVTGNYYHNGGDKFAGTGYATSYTQVPSDGRHLFQTSSASGTVGNAVTMNTLMTLAANGNAGIGTSPIAPLTVAKVTANMVASRSQIAITTGGNYGNVIGSGVEKYLDLSFYGFTNAEVARIRSWDESNVTLNGSLTFWTLPAGGSVTERMRITSDGKVGIGLTNPQSQLHLNGELTFTEAGYDTVRKHVISHGHSDGSSPNNYISFNVSNGAGSTAERMRINGNGNLLIGTSTDNGYKLYVSGTIYATGNITANSDLTLKKNLKLIDNPIDKLMQLNGYAYQWKANDEHQYGVIAQEVEKILPYAVSTGYDGIKGVSYNQIIPVLIEAIKTQQAEINTLKSKLA